MWNLSPRLDCFGIVGFGNYFSSGGLFPPPEFLVHISVEGFLVWIYIHVRAADSRRFHCVQSHLQLFVFRSTVRPNSFFTFGLYWGPAMRHRPSRTLLSFITHGGPRFSFLSSTIFALIFPHALLFKENISLFRAFEVALVHDEKVALNHPDLELHNHVSDHRAVFSDCLDDWQQLFLG
jgi:hypothetical protein